MQKQGNIYIFSFAAIVCIIVSIIVAVSATALKPKQKQEARLDVVRNILSVSGIPDEKIKAMKPDEVLTNFRENYSPLFLDRNSTKVERLSLEKPLLELGYTQEELDEMFAFELISVFNNKVALLSKRAGKSRKEYDPGYKLVFLNGDQKSVKQYILPIDGYGLWGMMYGYISLDKDLNTVTGIRFYNHQETPGLGGECEKPWFTDQFTGKKILSENGEFVSVSVIKGRVSEMYGEDEAVHYVDGISGATITGQAITDFVKEDIIKFEPYFQTIRNTTINGGLP